MAAADAEPSAAVSTALPEEDASLGSSERGEEEEGEMVDVESLAPDLFDACRRNETQEAIRLVDLGVPATSVHSGWTCLHWAACNGMVEVIPKLLSAMPAKSSGGPLQVAAFRGHLRAVWQLLEASGDEDVDEVGNSSLHLAASAGHTSVVKVLLAHGYDPSLKNAFANTPADLATSPEVRRILRDFILNKKDSSSLTDGEQNLKRYEKAATDLNEKFDDAGALATALSRAKEMAVPSNLVTKGSHKLARLEARVALTDQLNEVRRMAPIISQRIFCDHVNKLKRLTREAKELLVAENKENLGEQDAGDDLDESLIEEADAVAGRSAAEYWVHQLTVPLAALKCADDTAPSAMKRLTSAVAQADAKRADLSLVQKARKLLGRLSAELDLKEALENIPVVRLPIPDPGPDYWKPEDSGRVDDTTQDFPHPSPDDGCYKWIPSKSLSALRAAAAHLAKARTKAQQTGAFEDLLHQADQKMNAISDDLRQLDRKDLEDREVAVASAEKMSKKLKKAKKKAAAAAKAAAAHGA